MAVNCVVDPTAKLAGGFGVIAIEDKAGVVAFFVQASTLVVNKNINATVRQ